MTMGARPFSDEEKAIIAAVWREDPGNDAHDVARIAGTRLGRPVSRPSALRYRPPGHVVDPERRRKRRAQAEAIASGRGVLTEGQRAVVAGTWRDMPGAVIADVAAEASRRLGRPISVGTAANYRPGEAAPSAPAPPPPRARGSTCLGPLAGWIEEARRVRRRLGIGRKGVA